MSHQKKTLQEEIENDVKSYNEYLTREIENPKEKNCRDVLNRAILLAASSDITINNSDKKSAENKLPVASYFAHGSRLLIEIPYNDENPDYLINWLSSGDSSKNSISKNYNQSNTKPDQVIYKRTAATHKAVYSRKLERHVEKKGKRYGFMSFLYSFYAYYRNSISSLLGQKTQIEETSHYGVDLSLKNSQKTAQHDGEHGHLYIYYKKPKKQEPGCIMLGCEGAAPSSPNHSKLGHSTEFSPSGGVKFGELLKLRNSEQTPQELKDIMIPNKWDSMRMVVTQETLEKVKTIDQYNLAYRLPQKEKIINTSLVTLPKKSNQSQKDPGRKRAFTEVHKPRDDDKSVQSITTRGA
jgi:hypothetical protein